jgi:hypothetical protein
VVVLYDISMGSIVPNGSLENAFKDMLTEFNDIYWDGANHKEDTEDEDIHSVPEGYPRGQRESAFSTCLWRVELVD